MIDLVRAPNPGPYTLDGTNSWIVNRHTVIDPGPSIEEHVDAILERAPAVRQILLTHRHGDHAPAAREVARRSGARILAPPGVLDDEVVDLRLTDGDRLDAGGLAIEAVATPGHTEEHFCFLSSDGDLFTGDMILGQGTTAIFPPDGNMGDYLRSLRRMSALRPRRIYPGHGPVRDDASALIEEYIEHRRMRERQIIDALEEGEASIPQLRARIYPAISPGVVPAAESQLLAHLIHLEAEGLVQESGGTYSSRATQ